MRQYQDVVLLSRFLPIVLVAVHLIWLSFLCRNNGFKMDVNIQTWHHFPLLTAQRLAWPRLVVFLCRERAADGRILHLVFLTNVLPCLYRSWITILKVKWKHVLTTRALWNRLYVQHTRVCLEIHNDFMWFEVLSWRLSWMHHVIVWHTC